METKVKSKISLGVRLLGTIGLIVTIILAVSFYLMAKRQEDQIIAQVDLQARTLFQQIVLTRSWVASQGDGGVYSEVIGEVQPNPYLLQMEGLPVNIDSQDGIAYTLRNPALVTRELSELAEQGNNYAFKITSLNLINPNNAPTEWEANALEGFEQGDNEDAFLIETTEEGEVYRYMAPLYIKESCIRCHQDYQIGDVRGGISVTVPMIEARASIQSNNQQLFFIGLSIILATLVIIGIFLRYQISRPLGELQQAAVSVSHGDLAARVPVRSQDEVGTLATAFNTMSAQLRTLINDQEQTIAERTKALQTSTEVGRSLSNLLDPDELVAQVVTQVQQAFNYYHVHIYLFNESEKTLEMVGGTGKAGQAMLLTKHTIPLGKGLVGRAAAQNESVLVEDTIQDPNWLANPLLPDTKSEMAVPITYEEQLFGVLDVQQNVVNGLTTGDTLLLESVADQVAVALHNARLYSQVQKQANQESILNEIGQQIRSAASVEMVLQVAARELAEKLGTPRATIEVGRDHIVGNGRSREETQ